MKVRLLDPDGDVLTNWHEATRKDTDVGGPRWLLDMRELLGRVAASTAGLSDCTLEIQSGR